MVTPDNEVVITVVAGSGLLIALTIVVIIAAARYQVRKQRHLADLRHMKLETEQLLLKTKFEVQEKALTDVSREIHDNVGQLLALLKMSIHAIKASDAASEGKRVTSTELVNRVITEVRALSKLLNADYISQQSIADMITREVDYIKRSSVLEVHFSTDGVEPSILPGKKLVIFRIAQECIQNALKHAQAQRLNISVFFTDNNLRLQIQDNGIGFDPSMIEAGNGLLNLKARAKAIGGTLEISTKPMSGCLITLAVSINEGSG